MQQDLSQYLEKLNVREGKIFDPVRSKWLQVQPEELVRQTLILYLTQTCGYSLSKISVEKEIKVYRRHKRFDLVYFGSAMQPLLLAECKSPGIALNQGVLEQAVTYNFALKAPFLLLTNGKELKWYKVDIDEKNYQEMDAAPVLE